MSCPNCECASCKSARSFWDDFRPPATRDKEKVAAVLERIKSMTPDEVHRLSVLSGIHNEDGSLTEEYGGERTDPR